MRGRHRRPKWMFLESSLSFFSRLTSCIASLSVRLFSYCLTLWYLRVRFAIELGATRQLVSLIPLLSPAYYGRCFFRNGGWFGRSCLLRLSRLFNKYIIPTYCISKWSVVRIDYCGNITSSFLKLNFLRREMIRESAMHVSDISKRSNQH